MVLVSLVAEASSTRVFSDWASEKTFRSLTARMTACVPCGASFFVIKSTDGGKTWSDSKKITSPPADAKDNPISLKLKKPATEGSIATHNPTVIADQKNGGIHILYGVEYNRVFHMTADDE